MVETEVGRHRHHHSDVVVGKRLLGVADWLSWVLEGAVQAGAFATLGVKDV